MLNLRSAPPPTLAPIPSGEERPLPGRRFGLPAVGFGALVLTFVGPAGIGDGPSPHDTAASMASHFETVRDNVLFTAPFGQLGAAAIVAFSLGLARRFARSGERAAAGFVAIGAFVTAAYLAVNQVIYTALAYEVATTSAEATKTLFVLTLLAVPLFGLGTAAALGGAALAGHRTRSMPRWWSAVSAMGAVVSFAAVFSYAHSDVWSPDVQQQTVFASLLLWLLVTPIAVRRADRSVNERNTK